jgi:hypothetical protein
VLECTYLLYNHESVSVRNYQNSMCKHVIYVTQVAVFVRLRFLSVQMRLYMDVCNTTTTLQLVYTFVISNAGYLLLYMEFLSKS